MDAVFLKLLNMSVTASWLIAAVIPLRWLLMKKAPKWASCLLWVIVAAALICPVRPESRASVIPDSQPITVEAYVTPADTADPTTGESAQPQNDTQTGEPIIQTTRQTISMGCCVWLAGMAVMLLCAAVSWLRLQRRVAASVEIDSGVLICDDVDSPFILGILRPRIYLPSALSDHDAHRVLAHERAHLARRDHWWKPLGFLLLTLHWFNPLVWVAYGLLCRDIELACDEKVIRTMDTADRKEYSDVLLRCSIPHHMIAACPLAFGEVGVKQRIKAVLHYKKPGFWVILTVFAVCIALCVGFLTKPVSAEPPEDHTAQQELLDKLHDEKDISAKLQDLDELTDRYDAALSADTLKAALEDSLNGTGIDWSQAEFDDGFCRSSKFYITVYHVDYLLSNRVLQRNDFITVVLFCRDGRYTIDSFAPDPESSLFLLTGEPYFAEISTSSGKAQVSIVLDPDTGEIRSVVSVAPMDSSFDGAEISTSSRNAQVSIVLDPNTGEIRSVISVPSMDSSFDGYEDLYTAISTHEDLHTWSDQTDKIPKGVILWHFLT